MKPAEVYQERFVPALFGPWAEQMVARAKIEPGHRILDVGCGTGALSAAAAARVGSGGEVVGLDPNEEMLEVARRVVPQASFHLGAAESIPMEADRFDRVVSQFAFMFFPEPVQALKEMTRVLAPGGTLTVAVLDKAENSPGYGALAELLDRLFGTEIGDAFRAPFALNDPDRIASLAREAGLDAQVASMPAHVRFPSVHALVAAEEACVWTLGGALDAEQIAILHREAATAMAPFVGANGEVQFEAPMWVLQAPRH